MKFGYTIFYVPQLEPTIRFYEAAFGFERRFVDESGYGELKTGATTLSFATLDFARANGFTIGEARADGPPPAVEVAFVTDDVAGALERAVAAGAVLVAPPQDKPWGQTVAYVRDLNGFLVELCTPVGEP